MKKIPFFSLRQSLILLRCSVALVFIAHALVRVINETTSQFSLFLLNKGFLFSTQIVWIITVFEIAGSILLAAGYYVKLISAGLILMLLVGIGLIHASFGWFVGEHGTGGCEYSFILIAVLIVVASADDEIRRSIK